MLLLLLFAVPVVVDDTFASDEVVFDAILVFAAALLFEVGSRNRRRVFFTVDIESIVGNE